MQLLAVLQESLYVPSGQHWHPCLYLKDPLGQHVHSVVVQAHFEVMIAVDKPNDGAASTAASKRAAANM